MNYTPRNPYIQVSRQSSFNSYRKYSDSKLLIEKKALQNSYNSVMNTLNQNLSPGSPYKSSSIVCLKSAPIESDSDDFLENIIFTSHSQSPSNKLKFNYNSRNIVKNHSQSSNQQMMEYFNEFNSSLLTLQNEINEIKYMIGNDFSSSSVK